MLLRTFIVVPNQSFLYKRKNLSVIVYGCGGVVYQSIYNNSNSWRVGFPTQDMARKCQQQLTKYGYMIVNNNDLIKTTKR